MNFDFTPLNIPDVILIKSNKNVDDRGYFREIFRASVFEAKGIPINFVQDNFSHSTRGILRGLHYQLPPKAQAKLVFVLKGEIFDVAVDIRKDSKTFGQYTSCQLSDNNGCCLFIPAGFAHGFCVLGEEASVFYKTTSEFAPALEGGIIWNDIKIGIEWPITNPKLSIKDLSLPSLNMELMPD